MTQQGFASVVVHFASLEDPRVSRSQLHPLINVLVIGLCAVICGASGFTEMEEFGKRRRKWLRKFLDLSNGIPSHDTFNAVFARLKPDAFERCLLSWIASLHEITAGQVLAIGRRCDVEILGQQRGTTKTGRYAADDDEIHSV